MDLVLLISYQLLICLKDNPTQQLLLLGTVVGAEY